MTFSLSSPSSLLKLPTQKLERPCTAKAFSWRKVYIAFDKFHFGGLRVSPVFSTPNPHVFLCLFPRLGVRSAKVAYFREITWKFWTEKLLAVLQLARPPLLSPKMWVMLYCIQLKASQDEFSNWILHFVSCFLIKHPVFVSSHCCDRTKGFNHRSSEELLNAL